MATVATAAHAGCADAIIPGGNEGPAPDAGAVVEIDAGAPAATDKRIVILMIGDGMGRGQLAAARRLSNLRVDQLPVRGEMITSSLSGITDSAAAATAMATGRKTYNGRIGIDRAGAAAESVVELAQRLGLGTGVVTTASLPHATPGAFTAHEMSRQDYPSIAADQALTVKPDVMLGGGMRYFADFIDPLAADGYAVATDRPGLTAAAGADRLVGVFADDHLDYVLDADGSQPTLTEMTLAALEVLDRNPDGFFLMVEGARIDMASHGNDFERAVTETLAFDAAVSAVVDWAAGRPDVTVLVTADHECGGLDVGSYPDVGWRWGSHTNARVDLFGAGPGSEPFDGQVLDHTWIHAAISARLEDREIEPPALVITPDGHLADLERVAEQLVPTGFGAGFNQLDALYAAGDSHGLAIGVEGVFEWNNNAVVLLIDVDPGSGIGVGDFAGAVTDGQGRADRIVAGLQARSPDDRFAPDYALVAWGGIDPHLEDLWDEAGLRGLYVPGDLPWIGAATNYGEGVRTEGAPAVAAPGEGFEAFVPWSTLGVGPGDTVAIAAVLVNSDGGYASNQALPAFEAGTENPGRSPFVLPGYIELPVGDGVE